MISNNIFDELVKKKEKRVNKEKIQEKKQKKNIMKESILLDFDNFDDSNNGKTSPPKVIEQVKKKKDDNGSKDIFYYFQKEEEIVIQEGNHYKNNKVRIYAEIKEEDVDIEKLPEKYKMMIKKTPLGGQDNLIETKIVMTKSKFFVVRTYKHLDAVNFEDDELEVDEEIEVQEEEEDSRNIG